MNEYDDFYNEPSEFDKQVDEFKQSLLSVVKDEYKAEMERLRKENEELQTVKKDFDSIKNDYRMKERQLEVKMQGAQREAYRARLSDLLVDHKFLMYRATSTYKEHQKCGMCNVNRKIPYTTPSGKEAFEDCGCAKKKTIYVPEEMVYASFSIRNGKAAVWYEIKENDRDDYLSRSSQHADQIYKQGVEYEELSSWYYGTFFESEEECQAYCDWLNAKEVTQ